MDMQIEKGQSVVTTRLYDAALLGDVPFLLDLLKEDPVILERCIIEKSSNIKQSPLHVAVAMGHLEFVVELLRRKPKLDEMIDNLKGSSPLHIASAKGHLQIIETLIDAKPNMCFARDQEGRTPIFVAAVYGQIDALGLLHRANPYAAQGRTNDGETILHLCVIYNQLKALERLLEMVDYDGNQLINSRDNDGNTVLHLAVIGKHSEMVEFFSGYPGLNKSAMNKNKMTALDIIGKKQNWKNSENRNVEQYLKRAKARPAKEVLKHQADGTWLEEQRTSLMVVASLIATMAFQVGINPPGGVWQDTNVVKNKNGNIVVQEDGSNDSTHYAGTSILSYTNEAYSIINFSSWYTQLLISNTIGLISSLGVILLLISGFPCRRHFLLILRIALWIAVAATTYTYYLAITILTYVKADNDGMYISTWFSLAACVGLIGIMLFAHFVRFILKLIAWERRQSLKSFCKMCFPSTAHNSSSSNHVSMDIQIEKGQSIVAMGHLEFVLELLRREPNLEETIDQSKRSSPLHIASLKGHLKIIEALIVAKPNMCFAHDQEGRTPIFIAAVTGQIEALELLHRANPYATQGRTNDGESILHLCVKHNQLKSLQRLLELVDDDGNQLINFRDNDGNTILHLACNDW
ncbi:uncharacterized protein LOC110705844 [Chenopodium quinoa]|uniref:uncharacterized protein LOC110705844 n=1 Tax=Chenopodium quinoa TaxID=63459 RepID=UPI000B7861A2|nr:uncharacterized protein LOC110705844 [Chenopodium quinoa]